MAISRHHIAKVNNKRMRGDWDGGGENIHLQAMWKLQIPEIHSMSNKAVIIFGVLFLCEIPISMK